MKKLVVRSGVSRRAFIGGTAAFAGLPLVGAPVQKPKGKSPEKAKGKAKPPAPEPPPNASWETPSGDATAPVLVRRLYLDLSPILPAKDICED